MSLRARRGMGTLHGWRVLTCYLLFAAALPAVFLPTAVATPASAQWRWSGVDRVVAFGDVHGAYDQLLRLLRGAGVIDGELHWSGSTTHLVSLGDIVDRGGESRKVLDLLMRLQGEAEAVGGRVHLVLGDHEVMLLTGELQYVSPAELAAFADEEPPGTRAAALERFVSGRGGGAIDRRALEEEFARRRPPGYFGHQAAFAPDGQYGRWLLERPVLLVIDDTALVHGGLPPVVAELGLEALNTRFLNDLRGYIQSWLELRAAALLSTETPLLQRAADARAWLTADPTASPRAELLAAVERLERLSVSPILGVDGPTWYGGTAHCNPLSEITITQAALDRLGARRVVVGHTPTADRRITSRMAGRVLMTDTEMLEPHPRGRPAAVVIEGNRVQAYYPDDGLLTDPVVQPRRIGTRPDLLTDDDLEEILRTAEVTKTEAIGTGVTDPQRLTLRLDDFEVRAARQTVTTPIYEGTGARKDRLLNKSDLYQYNVAAYRLDRLLGLDMVPVTVEREIDGQSGSLQFWVEDAVNHLEMETRGLEASGRCQLKTQYHLMYVFDTLIFNSDRTQENMLYTTDDWMLWLIDHSRAFRTHKGRPKGLQDVELRLSEEFAARLAALDYEQLRVALDDLLSRDQIRAILRRRDAILADWEEGR